MNKHDKPQLHLPLQYFPDAMRLMARVADFGDMKHDGCWTDDHPISFDYYAGAMLRHLTEHMEGKIRDSESNLPHLAHMAYNALCLCQTNIEKERLPDAGPE